MTLEFLLSRRSVVAAQLREPGPSPAQMQDILRAGVRVPDHKALAPWRFILFSGEARGRFGERLAEIYLRNNSDESRDSRVEQERNRFLRAPVVICVVSSPKESIKVPALEQLLSAGAACQNILHAATALGFRGQWVTEWPAYDADVARLLGLAAEEQVAGFIYLGTAAESPKERPRVDPSDITTYWQG